VVAGITVLVIDIYHPAVGVRGVAMALYAILALLLVARIHFLKRKREWEGEQISVDSDAGFSWGTRGLVTAIVLVILAWNVNSVVKAINPATPEHRKASNLWGDLRDRFENWWIRCAGPLWFHVNILANDFRWGRVATF